LPVTGGITVQLHTFPTQQEVTVSPELKDTVHILVQIVMVIQVPQKEYLEHLLFQQVEVPVALSSQEQVLIFQLPGIWVLK